MARRLRPWVKNTITVLVGSVAAVLIVLTVVERVRKENELERKRRENLSYVAQGEALNKVKDSLNSLLEFVDSQNVKLRESEDLVNHLKTEQEKLRPIVETNRQVIDAILDLQYQKSRSDVWLDRGLGFLTGILTSVIAAFLLRFFDKTKRVAVMQETAESVDKPTL